MLNTPPQKKKKDYWLLMPVTLVLGKENEDSLGLAGHLLLRSSELQVQ